jgi:hypothetical protein
MKIKGIARILFRPFLPSIGEHGHGGGGGVESFAVGDVGEKAETGYYMEAPEEVSV